MMSTGKWYSLRTLTHNNMTLEERIKRYWNTQPCNIRHSKNNVGTVDFFREVSERRYRVEPHIPEFAGFHHWNGKRVLEVGCGIGSDAEEFAKHGADYVGIDLSDQSVALCRQRFETLGLDGEFYNIDATDAAALAELGQFDLVYSYGVIHHFPGIEQIISNIHQVVRPGGEFRFMVYAKNSWKYAMIQKGLDQYEAQAGCPYAQAFSKEEIYDLMKTGWTVERLRQDHCFMYNVAEYKKGNYVLEPWFAAMPEAYQQAVREYLGWHLLVKARKI
jgi:2-polyprenyl-3-methyl-5-hydroxy-6-metoxy-1,4-benzoquinol methylase